MVYEYYIMALLALAPISEVRGAIIYGLSTQLNPILVFVLPVILNILTIPVIFWVLGKAHFMTFVKKIFGPRTYRKIEKHKPQFDKYGYWALLPFVAIPLPFTGAWTGALIAVFLNMNKHKALIAISIGIIIAATITYIGTAGVIKII